MAAKLTVRGQAVVPARPDELQLMIMVSVLHQTAERALGEAAARTQTLQVVFTELGIPGERWSTSGISIRQEREPENGHWVDRGYRAEERITVRLEDSKLVGRLLNEAVSRVRAQIEGPWWRVNLDNPARAEACKQAIADARQKAESYSQAIGMRLGEVESVVEPGTAGGGWRNYAPAHFAMAAAQPEGFVHSGELEVAAAVDVTFALEQP